MNCNYCSIAHRKFYCSDCIQEKLQKHNEQISFLIKEKDAAVTKATTFFEKATLLQQRIAEKNKRASRLEQMQERQTQLMNECSQKRQQLKELQRQLKERKTRLEEAQKRASLNQKKSQVQSTMKSWQKIHKMTVGTRRILVNEVSSLFELKPGVVEEVEHQAPTMTSSIELPPFSQPTAVPIEGKDDLYICGVTLSTRLIDVSKYRKEELNAPIGLVVHMLNLIIRYLGIKLPFMIFQKGVQYYIRMIPLNPQKWSSAKKFPLFLDKNFKRFVVGMAMLNYNLAYLCHTQGVEIPLSQIANTLQSLMACCRSPHLGIQSHALYYQGLRDLNFPIEFHQVLRATTLRYRCSELSSTSETPLPTLLHPSNQLPGDYFKVRHQKYNEEEEYEGLYVDSEDEEDVLVHCTSPSEQPSKGEEEGTATDGQNETWSLVEVAPFLGGRTAHNGNEGDSLFQMGAASIVPGVLNMIESLGGNSTNAYPSYSPNHHLERYLFARKKKRNHKA
ncbi:UV radiation resistance protein and autophagy-related subunit 14-domain-containing protein [Blakeslea trispora]|nr:UV radiation resistance protein and autophagy-related subunit 14-domain-containing protein [Blakeslea trispora]